MCWSPLSLINLRNFSTNCNWYNKLLITSAAQTTAAGSVSVYRLSLCLLLKSGFLLIQDRSGQTQTLIAVTRLQHEDAKFRTSCFYWIISVFWCIFLINMWDYSLLLFVSSWRSADLMSPDTSLISTLLDLMQTYVCFLKNHRADSQILSSTTSLSVL